MKRFLPLAIVSLVLVGCSSSEVQYRVTLDVPPQTDQATLLRTTLSVIERRLDRLEESIKDQSITQGSGSVTLRLVLSKQESADILTEELTQPFKLRIMNQVPDTQGQLEVQGHGWFAETGITQADIVWAEAAEDSKKKGVVRLIFTPAGREKLSALFRENKGNNIGIFVRDRLISKLTVHTDVLDENIVIREIPNAELARVFVDDLNVGLHVTFTPLP
jgi:hypothetical protein